MLQADFIVAGATLVDGTGGPARQGDLAVHDGRIAAVGNFATAGGLARAQMAVLDVGGAVASVAVRRRFVAAVLLGTVGYGMALLFAVQGAPDLALTQALVETLTLVIFVLVLRKLPAESPARTRAPRPPPAPFA